METDSNPKFIGEITTCIDVETPCSVERYSMIFLDTKPNNLDILAVFLFNSPNNYSIYILLLKIYLNY